MHGALAHKYAADTIPLLHFPPGPAFLQNLKSHSNISNTAGPKHLHFFINPKPKIAQNQVSYTIPPTKPFREKKLNINTK